MKLALLCGLLFLATVLGSSSRRMLWNMRADTFVHRTFDNESPDAHYYYLRVTRADVIKPGEENLHVILNEISDPEANIKMYIKTDAREVLKDLTAEGVQEYESRHAEFVLKVPTPPKQEFSIAIVCDKQGVEYSVSACMGDECSETTTVGLTAEPRKPKYPVSIRRRKHMAEIMASKAKKQAAMSENPAKRVFDPPPKLILSPMGGMTPLTFFMLFGDLAFSHDQSGLDASFASVNDEFDAACGLNHGVFNPSTYFYPQSPFTQVTNVPAFEVTYDYPPGTMLDGICFWAGSSASHRVVRLSIDVSDGGDFINVVPDFAVPPPPGMGGMPEPGIPIDFPSVMPVQQVRITALEVTAQNIMVIAEVAGRVVQEPEPINTRCFGTNCQCTIPNCEVENNPSSNCPKCMQCLALRPSCQVMDPVMDGGFEVNQGDVQIPIADGCLVFNTLADSISGTIGQDCLFLGPTASINGGINMLDMADCIINEGAEVFGNINLGEGNDCYIGEADSITGRIDGEDGDDFIVINGVGTDVNGLLDPVVGGAGNDCVSVTGAFVGDITLNDGDDCAFLHAGAEADVISGEVGQDHIAINAATVNEEVQAGDGDDIVEFNMGLVLGPIDGGLGHDEVYLIGGEALDAITTGDGDDVIITELMSVVVDVDAGIGNDCIEMTASNQPAASPTTSFSIIGGDGDDQMFISNNPEIGNVMGGTGCDLIVSCLNTASIGNGPILDVDGGADEDKCFVDMTGMAAGPQNCELRGDGVDGMGAPNDCFDPILVPSPIVVPP